MKRASWITLCVAFIVLSFALAFIPVSERVNLYLLFLFMGIAGLSVVMAFALNASLVKQRSIFYMVKALIALTMLLVSRYSALIYGGTFVLDGVWILLAGALLVDFRNGKRNITNIIFTLAAVILTFAPGFRSVSYFVMAINGTVYSLLNDDDVDGYSALYVASYSLSLSMGFVPVFGRLCFGSFIPLGLLGFGYLRDQYLKLTSFKVEATRLAKEELELAQIEERVLKEEIRPHFLLNALNNVFVAFHESKEAGETMLQTLTALETRIDNASSKELIPLEEELGIIEELIHLFALERKKEILFEKVIEDKDLMISPMLLEPLVENSLQHSGILNQPGGMIRIEQTNDFGFATILVSDNGEGQIIPSKSRGIGLSNVMTRVSLLNEGHMDVRSDENGTVVEIRFKV